MDGRDRHGIGVCLSGGGHRASLFALGGLLYLVDSGVNRQVRSIASVSGGSITNAFVAKECDFQNVDPERFDKVASKLAHHIVHRGTFSTRMAIAAVAMTGGLVTGVALFGWPARLPWPAKIGLVALWGLLFLMRGHALSLLIGSRLFSSGGRRIRLGQPHSSVEHVLCATDLASNQPFYFSTWGQGFVYTPDYFWSSAPSVRLHSAVRSSAAFPGAFPPRRLRLLPGRLWRATAFDFHRRVPEFQTNPRTAFLADGGVWNNLGTDWMLTWVARWSAFLAYRDRFMSPPMPSSEFPRKLVVINASAPARAYRARWITIPFVGELASQLRAMRVMYDNTVQPRIEALRQQTRLRLMLDPDDPSARSLLRLRFDCALVSIGDEPFAGKHHRLRLSQFSDGVLQPRAAAALERGHKVGRSSVRGLALRFPGDDEPVNIDEIQETTSTVRTTLGRIRPRTALLLIIHGYVATEAECRFAFGMEEQTFPGPERFARLLKMAAPTLESRRILSRGSRD